MLETIHLPRLTSVGEYLWIGGIGALTNLDGLESLTSVGDLRIVGNAALTNVDGLESLTTVSSSLSIVDNDALTNIDGLASLTSVGGHPYIASNTTLCQSLVDAFVDALVALGWQGAATMFANADC